MNDDDAGRPATRRESMAIWSAVTVGCLIWAAVIGYILEKVMGQ